MKLDETSKYKGPWRGFNQLYGETPEHLCWTPLLPGQVTLIWPPGSAVEPVYESQEGMGHATMPFACSPTFVGHILDGEIMIII